MNMYRITNRISGLVLGVFSADNADEALDALAQDAGYHDYTHAYRVGGFDAFELLIERVTADGSAEKVWPHY